MMVEQWSRPRRRAAAVSILFLLIAMLYLTLVAPLRAVTQGYEGEIERLSRKLELSHQILNEGEAARRHLQLLTMAEKRNGYYMESERETLAAAELQRRVKLIVEQSGGSIVSSQVLGEREEEGLQQVVLRTTLRLGMAALEKTLYTLETQPPVLLLDNINITARPSGSTARWRGNVEQQELDVRLDILGYRKNH